jgi:hypothetical protein
MEKKQVSSVSPTDNKIHENGVEYREVEMPGLKEPFKLFNSSSSKRLEGEKYTEYKIRRTLNNSNDKEKSRGILFHNSKKLGTYIKEK